MRNRVGDIPSWIRWSVREIVVACFSVENLIRDAGGGVLLYWVVSRPLQENVDIADPGGCAV